MDRWDRKWVMLACDAGRAMSLASIPVAYALLIFAVNGIGSILGSLLAPHLEHRLTVGQSILLCRWYFVLIWPLYALTPFPPVLGAIEFGTGLVDPIEDVPYFSRRLKLIPDELRGRVLSACRLFPGTMRPLGWH
ncbi:MAG TPA: hypothetical protein VNE38_12990 [Ktedonobacteraceae bacterium]|nr:hypothetical protein [Ktedonobacteraceae bacterium]